MRIEEIKAYKTSDGRMFEDQKQAQEEQNEINLIDEIRMLLETTAEYRQEAQDAIVLFFKEYHEEIYDILNNNKF